MKSSSNIVVLKNRSFRRLLSQIQDFTVNNKYNIHRIWYVRGWFWTTYYAKLGSNDRLDIIIGPVDKIRKADSNIQLEFVIGPVGTTC
jgi:hypothetical protein